MFLRALHSLGSGLVNCYAIIPEEPWRGAAAERADTASKLCALSWKQSLCAGSSLELTIDFMRASVRTTQLSRMTGWGCSWFFWSASPVSTGLWTLPQQSGTQRVSGCLDPGRKENQELKDTFESSLGGI